MSTDHRAEAIAALRADLTAELTLRTREDGGREGFIAPGYGCPCFAAGARSGWDGHPQLGDTAMFPGETRVVGFVFLSGEDAARELREAGAFELREGARVIGVATVIR